MLRGKLTAKGDLAQINSGVRPPNMAPPGAGRRGAFGAAKRANGICYSEQPSRIEPNINNQDEKVGGRTYVIGYEPYEERIRGDADGRCYTDDDGSQNRGPHFNDEAKNHLDYGLPEFEKQ